MSAAVLAPKKQLLQIQHAVNEIYAISHGTEFSSCSKELFLSKVPFETMNLCSRQLKLTAFQLPLQPLSGIYQDFINSWTLDSSSQGKITN